MALHEKRDRPVRCPGRPPGAAGDLEPESGISSAAGVDAERQAEVERAIEGQQRAHGRATERAASHRPQPIARGRAAVADSIRPPGRPLAEDAKDG